MFHVKHPRGPGPLEAVRASLAALETGGLLRESRPPPADRDDAVSFRSNDYLGLAAGGHGAGASRLVGGDKEEHRALEAAVAFWLGADSGLLFASGYAANVGLLSALGDAGTLLVSDELNHASLIDGARLARARVCITPHLDLDAVREALDARVEPVAWVVVESYYSMDADSPDLGALATICREASAGLIVDEAHAIGVFGPGGRGLAAEHGVEPEARLVAFGKAFGAQGGMVVGASEIRELLWNRARSFVFSTGVSPRLVADLATQLDRVKRGDDLRANLHARAHQLRAGLSSLGLDVRGHGPIVPVVLGHPGRAVDIARALGDLGVSVQAIRPPSVPAGTARIRMTLSAVSTESSVQHALAAWARVLERFT